MGKCEFLSGENDQIAKEECHEALEACIELGKGDGMVCIQRWKNEMIWRL